MLQLVDIVTSVSKHNSIKLPKLDITYTKGHYFRKFNEMFCECYSNIEFINWGKNSLQLKFVEDPILL